MSDQTSISWTDATWNPVVGCTRLSTGCANCYAVRQIRRLAGHPNPKIATAFADLVERHDNGQLDWTGTVRCLPERLNQPGSWKRPRRIFVCSLADLFYERVSFPFVKEVFDVMLTHCQHTYIVLTKRPASLVAFLTQYPSYRRLLPDYQMIWVGVSVENQKAADERIPLLLQVPAAVRFLSCEPLLGPIDLARVAYHRGYGEAWTNVLAGYRVQNSPGSGLTGVIHQPTGRVNWVICGGESGPHYRTMNLDWARSLRDDCLAANVPFFFKQASAYRPETGQELDGKCWRQVPALF